MSLRNYVSFSFSYYVVLLLKVAEILPFIHIWNQISPHQKPQLNLFILILKLLKQISSWQSRAVINFDCIDFNFLGATECVLDR